MADYLTDAFIRLRQKLKRVSSRILPEADGAEDILQDSFVKLWRRQYPLQSEKEAEALLTRTVRNASLNERRRVRSVPLERYYADDSSDTQEKERAFAQMKEKIQAQSLSFPSCPETGSSGGPGNRALRSTWGYNLVLCF